MRFTGGKKMANMIFVLAGLVTGIFSGLIGIGGGVIIIPFLVYIIGFSQHAAQGTTLAMMVPPIGFLAAWQYYRNGYVDLKVAGLICIGFFLGGLLGARVAAYLPDLLLKKFFGVFLLGVALKMILGK